MVKAPGIRGRLREFFERRHGQIVTVEMLAELTEGREPRRWIKELRYEDGMEILTSRERPDLQPNEFVYVGKTTGD